MQCPRLVDDRRMGGWEPIAYDPSDHGFERRWKTANRRIDPPPRTPCSNPLEMPFRKLRPKNSAGTMTLDEELLRTIIDMFTVKAIVTLPFTEILEKLKRENPHLLYLLFDDPDYVWSYIRCYPEHFAIDRDPRYPENIWYLFKCKVIAKSDRRRYQREFESGNITDVSQKFSDEEWNEIRYDEEAERQALVHIRAVFYQVATKFKTDKGYTAQLPIRFLQEILEKGQVPRNVREYVGEKVLAFLYRRSHYFSVFGDKFGVLPAGYIDAIRSLTDALRNKGCYDLQDYFNFFCSSPLLGQTAARLLFADTDKSMYNNFLLCLHRHKLLFRLRPRDRIVELRHGVVPLVDVSQVKTVPFYDNVNAVASFEDFKRFEDEQLTDAASEDADHEGEYCMFDLPSFPKPSSYTMRWLSENFSEMGTDSPVAVIEGNSCTCVEPSKVSVYGPGVEPGVRSLHPTNFTIDCEKAGAGEIEVSLNDDKGSKVDIDVLENSDGTFTVKYTAPRPGIYQVRVVFAGTEIPGSPIRVNVQPHLDLGVRVEGLDDSKCRARGEGLVHGYVGFPCEFVVETKGAGPGAVNVTLEGPSKACIESHDAEDGAQRSLYIPSEPGEYSLSIRFADVNIPGSPFLVTVDYPVDASKVSASGPGLEQSNCRANAPLQFHVDASKSGFAPLNVVVLSDNRDVSPLPEVRERSSNVYDITYYPSAAGTICTVHVTYGGTDIPNSPYRMQVLPTSEADKVRLIAGEGVVPPGEIPATLPYTVTIDTRNAGHANLEVSVLDPDKQPIPVDVVDKRDGVYDVTLIPCDTGLYTVVIKYGGEEISASPYNVVAQPVGDASKCFIADGFRERVAVNEQYSITVNAAEAGGPGAVTCRVQPLTTAPGSCLVNVQDNKDGTFSIFYTLKGCGTYAITVKFGGQPVPPGVWNVNAVPAEQLTSFEGSVIHSLRYERDYTDSVLSLSPIDLVLPSALLRDLAVEVITPTRKIDYPFLRDNRDGTTTIRYSPREAGLHEMHIRHNGDHVEGSPFTVKGPGLGVVSEQMQQMRTAAHQATPGNQCELCIKIPGTEVGNLSGSLMSPNGMSEDVEVVEVSEQLYEVRFVPRDVGLHTISVLHKGEHICGSPFLFTVGTIKCGRGAHKVRMAGLGLHQGTVNQPLTFNIYTREAGLGNLAVTIEGPSKAKIDFKDHKDGNCYITYSVSKPGNYKIAIKFDEVHIPNSPFKACITAATDEAVKMEVVPLQSHILPVNDSAVVTVLTHGAKGYLDAKVTAPSGDTNDCFSIPSSDGDSYFVTFVPQELGYHYFHLKLDGIPLAVSPVRVSVIDRDAASGADGAPPSSRVTCDGSGLKKAYIGRKNAFTVDCSKAGASRLLVVAIMTPSGPSDDVYIKYAGEGKYVVEYSVLEQGSCSVHVKYGDEDVPGSPFPVTV